MKNGKKACKMQNNSIALKLAFSLCFSTVIHCQHQIIITLDLHICRTYNEQQ